MSDGSVASVKNTESRVPSYSNDDSMIAMILYTNTLDLAYHLFASDRLRTQSSPNNLKCEL